LVQIDALISKYQLTTVGISSSNVDGVENIPFRTAYKSQLDRLIKVGPNRALLRLCHGLKMYERRYFWKTDIRSVISKLKGRAFDLIICNDVESLPLCAHLKEMFGCKLYLDCHEYTPRQWDGDPNFKKKGIYWTHLLHRFARSIDLATTVCQSIANEYEEEFGFKCANLVYNAPFLEPELTPGRVAEDQIRMVHHGGLNRNRSPETMLKLMAHLDDRFSLDFFLIDNDPVYLCEFQEAAEKYPRVKFHAPVPTRKISRRLNEYDLGLFMLDPTSFNYRNALPNKFFEFIQARLGIAIWPSHEMKRFVDIHDLGVVSVDFTVESMAKALNQLSPTKLFHYKQNAASIANTYCAEASVKTILSNVQSLV